VAESQTVAASMDHLYYPAAPALPAKNQGKKKSPNKTLITNIIQQNSQCFFSFLLLLVEGISCKG
jgi:hypothetical protein